MNKTNKILVGIFLVAAVVSAGLYFKKASKYDEYRAQINNAVKDPGSTEFKNEKTSPNGIYCAEVNSKNSYGAFVGFERVMAKVDVFEGKSDGYVFFEREGLEGSGGAEVVILAQIELETVREHNKAMEREIAGGNKAAPNEQEYRETALRKVFEEEWSENCSLKISEVAPVVVTQVEVKPPPPMPNNGEPGQYADLRMEL